MKLTTHLVIAAGLGLGVLSGRAQAPALPAGAEPAAQFMTDYTRLLQAGDREGLIALYSTKGTLIMSAGRDELVSPEQTAVFYRKNWTPPAGFAWRDLAYRVMSPDVVMVTGSFAWTDPRSAGPVVSAYSATLIREAGGWRFRSAAEFSAVPAAPVATVSANPPAAPPAGMAVPAAAAPSAEKARRRARLHNFVRAYEPIQLGLTQDEGDEVFMDFRMSLMFPLIGGYWDTPKPDKDQWRVTQWLYDSHTGLFLSGTVRAGQYIWGRPSAPVVPRRFNPQVFLRYWFPGLNHRYSEHTYVDAIYGHESNGQVISSLDSFNQQREVFRRLEDDPDSQVAADRSFRSARDTISRGWDYAGFELSVDKNENVFARVRVREFLPGGILQQGAEQSNPWEGFGPTHPRRQYDGLMVQTSIFGSPFPNAPSWLKGRYTFTYTTGLSQPLLHSTFQIDLAAEFFRRPLSLWFRTGYNTNLTDYFLHNNSTGVSISIWDF